MQRYYTTVSRYVHGKYVAADPEHPAIVEFEDEIKVPKDDRTLTPVTDEEAPPPSAQKLKPPFARVERGPAKAFKGGRASDQDPGSNS